MSAQCSPFWRGQGQFSLLYTPPPNTRLFCRLLRGQRGQPQPRRGGGHDAVDVAVLRQAEFLHQRVFRVQPEIQMIHTYVFDNESIMPRRERRCIASWWSPCRCWMDRKCDPCRPKAVGAVGELVPYWITGAFRLERIYVCRRHVRMQEQAIQQRRKSAQPHESPRAWQCARLSQSKRPKGKVRDIETTMRPCESPVKVFAKEVVNNEQKKASTVCIHIGGQSLPPDEEVRKTGRRPLPARTRDLPICVVYANEAYDPGWQDITQAKHYVRIHRLL